MRFFAIVLILAFASAACSIGNPISHAYQDPKKGVEQRAEDLLRRMTDDEKMEMLRGSGAMLTRPISRLSVPAIQLADPVTAYPPDVAMAATWDTKLTGRVARLLALDALAHGRDQVLGPDVTRTGYGEDPWLAARLAVAYVSAMQNEGVIPTLTNFPGTNSTDERVLNEIYLPPFRSAIEEIGLWSIQSGSTDPHVLTDILKYNWGFKGFVIAQAGAVRDPLAAAQAGIDLEMPGVDLKPFVAQGRLGRDAVDDKVRRILRAMFATTVFDRGQQAKNQTITPEHRFVAHEAAVESIILLKNDLLKNDGYVLPLQTEKGRNIALIAPHPLERMQARAGSRFHVEYAPTGSPSAAADLARRSDVAVVFADSPALVEAVAKANRRTVVVLGTASLANVAASARQAPAILCAWDTEREDGQAIAEILFGDANPSGKLPITVAKEPPDSAGIYVGYRYFDQHTIEPLFPFGHGLSYTAFEYTDLKISPQTPRYGQLVQVTLNVRNRGSRAGAEVVELYVHQAKSSADRPPKELKAFSRVELKPGETQTVSFELDRHAMSFYDPLVKDWGTEPGVFDLLVGSSSRDIRLKGSLELFR
jgi:beta-glucosidase